MSYGSFTELRVCVDMIYSKGPINIIYNMSIYLCTYPTTCTCSYSNTGFVCQHIIIPYQYITNKYQNTNISRNYLAITWIFSVLNELFCKYIVRILNSQCHHLSHEKKKSCFPLNWLFHRDPYVMVYHNPHITG